MRGLERFPPDLKRKVTECIFHHFFDRCTPAGVRTLDTLIKSQVLYQLSYGCNIFTSSFSTLPELRVQR